MKLLYLVKLTLCTTLLQCSLGQAAQNKFGSSVRQSKKIQDEEAKIESIKFKPNIERNGKSA